jgi:hypothetical protein
VFLGLCPALTPSPTPNPLSTVDGELEDDEDEGCRRRGAELDDADQQMKVQA